jgi:preprotein translocase subunit SecF
MVMGVFALTWTEFSLTTVAALLTVIGYSMNDTVVVFDRIRENEHKLKDKKLDRVINISINETLSRTLLTGLTTFSTTLAMNLLGTGLVKNFAFAMNIGIIVGTYSSIFVAAPIVLWLNERYFSKRPAARRPAPASEPA